MKYSEEYRDRELVNQLSRQIQELSLGPATLMEVCGTHTMAVARFGLKSLLPLQVKLVSGPGCPVCVTAQEDIDAFLALGALFGVGGFAGMYLGARLQRFFPGTAIRIGLGLIITGLALRYIMGFFLG